MKLFHTFKIDFSLVFLFFYYFDFLFFNHKLCYLFLQAEAGLINTQLGVERSERKMQELKILKAHDENRLFQIGTV